MHDAFHVPLWLWGVAVAVVLAVAAADVLLASRSRGREPGLREAALCTAGVVALGAIFGLALAAVAGPKASGQFYAGWLTEYSLSLDNLLVFLILISRSKVPPHLQSRVVLAGILLALLLRGGAIALGAAALRKFQWVEYLFGAFLIYTAAQVAARRRLGVGGAPADGSPPGTARAPPFVRRGRAARLADRLSRGGPVRPLLVLVIALGVTDVIFALDSIPAIFGLTRNPFLVFSANVFALLGLRHLYFLAGGLLSRLVYLPAGIAVVLSFIGIKLIAQALRGDGVTRIGPVPVPGISAWLSLVIIVVVLGATALASVTATRHRDRTDPDGRQQPP